MDPSVGLVELFLPVPLFRNAHAFKEDFIVKSALLSIYRSSTMHDSLQKSPRFYLLYSPIPHPSQGKGCQGLTSQHYLPSLPSPFQYL